MSKCFYVYGLRDPRDQQIYYIGLATNKSRPLQHLACKKNQKKYAWIETLRQENLTYVVIILEDCQSVEELRSAEQWWIRYGRSQRWPLLNILDGGDGAFGNTWNRGRFHSSATGRKISEAKREDISGHRFGTLVAIEYDDVSHWILRCDCGSITRVHLQNLKRGRTTTCGDRSKHPKNPGQGSKPTDAIRSDNTTSARGIHLAMDGRPKPWFARLRGRHLGSFATFDEAMCARQSAMEAECQPSV